MLLLLFRRKVYSYGHACALRSFFTVADIYEAAEDGRESQCFITTSYDATSHFETTCLDVLDVWKRITGEDLDLNKQLTKTAQTD